MRRRTACLLGIVAAAGTLSIGAGSASAQSGQLPPPDACGTSAYGSPGNVSVTVHLTYDPCHLSVHAYAQCINGRGATVGYANGGTIYNAGQSSKADCVNAGIGHFGWWSLYGSTWTYHSIR